MVGWLAVLLISLAVSVVSYLLQPRPKVSRPEETKNLDDPTAEAGKPICVVFGEMTIKDPNILWFGDKGIRTYKVQA